MKKQFLAVAAFLFIVQLANAQTEKGTQNLGLNAGFSSTKGDNTYNNPTPGATTQQKITQTSFNIGPAYSYFIADNLDLGVTLNYGHFKRDESYVTPNKQTSNSIGGALQVRKYFLYDNKIGIRTGARAGYNYQTADYNYDPIFSTASNKTKSNIYYGGLLADAVYYPAKHVGVAAMIANLTYTHQKSDSGNQVTGKTDSFEFSFVDNLSLSVFYTF